MLIEEVFYANAARHFAVFLELVFAILEGETEFSPNWHIDAMANLLQQCADGEITRAVMTVPPRQMKSLSASVAFVAFIWGLNPAAKFMCLSYGDTLALDFAVKTKRILMSPEYRKIFPFTQLADGPIDMLRTTAGGVRMATSVTGAGTGLGADFIIVDDITKAGATPQERKKAIEILQNSFRSRLNSKEKGVIIVVAQRTHTDDLVGFLLSQGGWTHLNLPAVAQKNEVIDLGYGRNHVRKKGDILHPERESAEILEQLRGELGDDVYSAQYLQAPGVAGGTIYRKHWFGQYGTRLELNQCEARVIVVDAALTAAATGDFSVASVVGVRGARCELWDVWRDHVDIDGLLDSVERLMRTYKATHVFIENSALGAPLLQILQKKHRTGVHAVNTGGLSKPERAAKFLKFYRDKSLWLPILAPWLAALEEELFSFPGSMYSDQVDTLIYFAYCMTKGLYMWDPIDLMRSPPRGRLIDPLTGRRIYR